jgi:DNA-binding MarR family transcriptional regulator
MEINHNSNKKSKLTLEFTKLEKIIDKKTEIVSLLKNTTRLRLILILLIFKKLSLTRLSNLLGRTKAAVSRHLKKFEQLGFIITTRRKARGSIDAKIYELKPSFIKIISIVSKDFLSFQEKNKLRTMNYALKNEIQFYELFKSILEHITLYYRAINDYIMKTKLESSDALKGFDINNLMDNQILVLTEKQKKEYDNLMIEFQEKLTEIISNKKKI